MEFYWALLTIEINHGWLQWSAASTCPKQISSDKTWIIQKPEAVRTKTHKIEVENQKTEIFIINSG
jgi:hypothetical protein